MAFRASGALQGLCMAIAAGRAAMVNAAPTFVGNARVRTVVTSKPVIRCMAARTIQAKHACMKDRVGMASNAVGR